MLGLLIVSLWLIPLLLLLLVGYLWMPGGKTCPCCGAETLLLQYPAARLFARRMHLRWCLHCGWEGFTRARRTRRISPPWVIVARDAEETDRDAPSPG
jgi:hypothetical protein